MVVRALSNSFIAACLVTATARFDAQVHAGENGREGSSTPVVIKDGLIVLQGIGSTFSAPFRWEGDDWLCAAGVVGATGVSAMLDDEGLDLADRNRTAFNDGLQKVVVRFAEVPGVLLVAGMYATGLFLDDQWLRETAALTTAALIATTLLTQVAKPIAGRARPYTGLGNHRFKPFTNKVGFKSLPSGHTAVAFSISGVISERIGNPYASIALYAIAGASSFSRVYSRDHWLSDVLFTALCSTSIAHSIVRGHEQNVREPKAQQRVRFVPSASGFSLVWMF